ncbi:hypothetical protein [Pelosinus baikalensis]|uniref:Uncharacterized protein n=1 Tax=Pelosinus baikalensis TaxID=2892015 RepID=A0ABS8HTI7_9FIRM|nr:hypothetical protein [Pelosinus baikalensis]MCC5466491.1 hypothetical protein [Pelosinus baikalensis]
MQRKQAFFGEVKTKDKSNEIISIPELLDLLDLKGAVVTMRAMGCQKDIVKKIVNEKSGLSYWSKR